MISMKLLQSLLFSALLAYLAVRPAHADGSVDLAIAEVAFQKGLNALAQAGTLPSEFGSDEPGSSLKLQCLAPIMRFPRADFDTDLHDRIILHLVCAFKSPKYGFTVPCPYRSASEVPASELAIDGQRQCAQIQVSLLPTLENVGGSQKLTLSFLKVERLALFPPSFDPQIAQAFPPVEKLLLRQLNQNFEKVKNPWFRSLVPIPLNIQGWSQSFQGAAVRTTFTATPEKIWIDAPARALRIRVHFQRRTP